MKKFILLFLFFSFKQVAMAQIDSTLAGQLQSILDNSVSKSGNNGVSAHLIMSNGETWGGTAGVGKGNISITDTTLFHGASTTKFNMAILMLLLVEDGLIDLDESWNNYVSLNVDFDTLITVRQLLNHTSGIADYLETARSGNDVTSDFNFFYTPRYLLENIVSGIPDFEAGSNFQYSNSNYVLAAFIAEAVTGNPVQTELRNRIWNPLGMHHTYFGAYETYTEPTAGVWWNFGNGLTDYSNVPTTSMLSYGYAAGNIVSCPTDLAILLNAVLKNQLLNTQSLNEMLTFVHRSFSSWTAGYGLGIHHLLGLTSETVIGHDGYYTNLTDMFHSVDGDFTLVTMTNTQTSWFGIFNPMYEIVSAYRPLSGVLENADKVQADLTMYPNPAQNHFNITSEQIIIEIEIIDALGDIFYQSTPNDKSISLPIDQGGVYFVIVRTNKQTVSRKLIVKN
jgi:D-alanyl-D-alanine carboxypeptidase